MAENGLGSEKAFAFDTLAIHGGNGKEGANGAVVPPISMSAVYEVPNLKWEGHVYSRLSNPGRDAFETTLAACARAKFCLAMASGMGAISGVLSLLGSGDHIIAMEDLYSGTLERLESFMSRNNISVTFADAKGFESSFRPNTKMVMCESLSNPTLTLLDIQEVARATKQYSENCLLVVDNTFLSPFGMHPLELGADIEVHSVTKYINGHSDVVMGAILTNDTELHSDLRAQQSIMGALPSPFDCFLASRGLRTLGLRMKRHEANATALVKVIRASPVVLKVKYPGLPETSDPSKRNVESHVHCYGGMISFWLEGGVAAAKAFAQCLEVATLAVSLGGVETLVELPALMTHKGIDRKVRERLGITENMIRLSVGIEDIDDLTRDVERALSAAARVAGGVAFGTL